MGFKVNRKKAEKVEDRATDRDGWPIVVGARVHVGPRSTALSESPVSGYSGQVQRVYKTERHGWVIQVREFETWMRRDARAGAARVQAGKATASQQVDQAAFEITKAKAKKMLAAAAKERKKL